MKTRRWVPLMLVGLLFLTLGSMAQADLSPARPGAVGEPSLPPGGAPKSGPPDLKNTVTSATATGLAKKRIDIAISDVWESSPAVAQCAGGQYLVVYLRGDGIVGQRLDGDGNLLGDVFSISDALHENLYPDVACDWYSNRFLVVWSYDYVGDGLDWDLRARGVYGDHQATGDQLYGSELRVSQDGAGVDEIMPAVACNINAHSCLVAFEYHTATALDIYAQRVRVDASDISKEGGRFVISDSDQPESFPEVAWGGYDQDYLVAWQHYENSAHHHRIVTAYVWDTNQAGSQMQTGTIYLIEPGSYDQNQMWPAVAYNRFVRQFLVAFDYDYYGNDSDWDIEAVRLTPGGGSVGSVFAIAVSTAQELYPRVAFSGGVVNIAGGTGANQYLVTYGRNYPPDVLYGQAVKGAYDSTTSQRDGAPIAVGDDLVSSEYDLAGSVFNGRYLAVWDAPGDGGSDVLGQILAPHVVTLPIVQR